MSPITYYALVLDVVGFSVLPEEDQVHIAYTFTRIAKSTMWKRNLLEAERCIALPTGDGVALCLVDARVEDIAGIAQEMLASVLACSKRFGVRIGVHRGRGFIYSDINGGRNIAGPGINWATRVASAADNCTIYLSYAVGQELEGITAFRPLIINRGMRTMKHGKNELLWELLPTGSQVDEHRGFTGNHDVRTDYRFSLKKESKGVAWLFRLGLHGGAASRGSIFHTLPGGQQTIVRPLASWPEDLEVQQVMKVDEPYIEAPFSSDPGVLVLTDRSSILPPGDHALRFKYEGGGCGLVVDWVRMVPLYLDAQSEDFSLIASAREPGAPGDPFVRVPDALLNDDGEF